MNKDLLMGSAALALGATAIVVSLSVGANHNLSASQVSGNTQIDENVAYSPSVYWQTKIRAMTRLAAPIVGMTREEAEAFCKENGLRFRVLDDGAITMELIWNRVNVTLVDKVVKYYDIG